MEEASSENNWFYEEKGVRKGPVSQNEMLALIKTGSISRKDVVWKEGFSDWVSLENTELSNLMSSSTPPPLSGEHVNNAMVWLLAFTPVWGSIFFTFCMLVFSRVFGQMYTMLLSGILLFAIYICLYKIDEKNIKTAGHNYDKINPWAWIVLPVYLYQRARCLNQSLIHLYFWIGSFVLSLFL